MKNDIINRDISLIQRSTGLENPVLRHFVKKYNLSPIDAVVLGILLELTGHRKMDPRNRENKHTRGIMLFARRKDSKSL